MSKQIILSNRLTHYTSNPERKKLFGRFLINLNNCLSKLYPEYTISFHDKAITHIKAEDTLECCEIGNFLIKLPTKDFWRKSIGDYQ